MTTDTEDDGFTTVHQSAAFAGAGAGVVVRPDLPLTLSAAQAEIVALRGREMKLREEIAKLRNFIRGLSFAEHPIPDSWADAAHRIIKSGGDDE